MNQQERKSSFRPQMKLSRNVRFQVSLAPFCASTTMDPILVRKMYICLDKAKHAVLDDCHKKFKTLDIKQKVTSIKRNAL